MATQAQQAAPKNSGSANSSKSKENPFLSRESATKSNAIEVPSLNLPKGGGALKGIDEKFSVNAVNGTASFSIPLPVSPARGASPALSLSYNSGSGNGIFGLGWNLGLSSIKRKTDKELPQYLDSIDSDTFLFSEAEDLVPAYQKEPDGSFSKDAQGNYIIAEKNSPDGTHRIRYYRPRIEGLFARIERWTEKTTGAIKWRIITKENTTTLFGWTPGAVIADPTNPARVYEWLPEFVFDDKGNCTHYIYKEEDNLGLDTALLHNKNRLSGGNLAYTNTYLEKVLYGNQSPYKQFGDAFPPETDYLFSTVFDYGEYNSISPFDKINDWDFRPDAFSHYTAGFEIRTTRLCRRVLLFHHFSGANEYNGLVRSLNFQYDTASQADFTFLKTIATTGYIKKADGSYSQKSLPPMEFTYQPHDWSAEVKTIAPDALAHAPAGIEEAPYQFTDLYNEGLAGILTEQANGWYYKHNLGDGKFEQAKLVTPKPSFTGLGSSLQLLDLDADGGKQLVSTSAEPKGFFELDDANDWQPFRNFHHFPNIDLSAPNVRLLDLNGDGKPEAVITEENVFTWYESDGRKGYKPAIKTSKPFDEEAGPAIVFADSTQSIFLADMSGDGLTDIVRIRNGEVCYWPNLGYGKFGAKVAMDHAPVFDHPDHFNPSYIKLADIDGSGTTDIIYLGKNQFSCWLNRSGNRFTASPFEIPAFPEIHNQANVTVTDLLGNGVACIVWSSPLSKDAGAPLRYIDLMNSKKPHLLIAYKNNLGKEVSLEYTPSTHYYLEDKAAGKPWVTKLHFPVHCISKTETRDTISGHRFVSSYSYHHGYYDHPEREFRGFGRVEQTDSEHFEHWVKGNASNITNAELHQEPVVSKTWFHTGAFLQKDVILTQFAHEYWYEEMERAGFPVTHPEHTLPDARLLVAPGLDPNLADEWSAEEWREALRACKSMPLRAETFARDAAKFGNTEEAIRRELTPYSVASKNCVIELLQPKGKNKAAVFVVKESEAITYSYERSLSPSFGGGQGEVDPRIAHNLNLKLDEYGNVLESASIVYPRLSPDSSLPAETQQDQAKTIILYTQNQFTNDVSLDDSYRLRLPSEVKTFELKGVAKTGGYYALSDFEDILTASANALYYETGKEPAAGTSQKRLLEHVRTNYYKNNLTGPLPLHQLEYRALPYENYQLAYTPALLEHIYSDKVDNPTLANLMLEGKFSHSIDEMGIADANWWIRSGTTQFTQGAETVADAQNRFFVPISYTDPYSAKTKVRYYGNYYLFIEQTENALGNTASVTIFNFRTLAPRRMKDANGNFSEAITDELGLVKAMAVFGKGSQADDVTNIEEATDAAESALIASFFNASDSVQLTTLGKQLLQHATMRFVYDFEVYGNTGKPTVVAAISRENHYRKPDGTLNPESPVQLAFEYSNGLGQVAMKKVQAEPGNAKSVTLNPDDTYSVTTVDTGALIPKQLRWLGNGKTILNNKGNPVKQYEPYFSVSWQYENFKELVETGVTPILYYDALGRLIKTDMPDGTFSKVEFDAWKQIVYDANDTVTETDWYLNRTNRLIDAQLTAEGKDPQREKEAADKAAKHAGTPNTLHFDTLGRPVLSVEHTKHIITEADELYRTKVKLDTEGNLRSVTDARELLSNSNKGNTVMQYQYDMLGHRVWQNSMDAGQRWLLVNILGNPLRTWDERGHEFRYFYDMAHRPTHSVVLGGDGTAPLNHIFERIFYGESLLLPGRTNEAALQAKNVLGQVIQLYDTGGLVDTPEYDFKGKPIATTRALFKNYKEVANWTDANLATDLETDTFTFTTETDALGRITRQVAPDGSVITPSYNEAGLLHAESVLHPGALTPSIYIKDIDYNEKGQREKITYGNDVSTRFYYDRETFRLKRLESKRQNNDPLQDWHYTFDAVGNITHIEDKNIPVVFFNNTKVTGVSEYTYDALYRLIEATGRENSAALSYGAEDNWNDAPFMHALNPGDPMSVRSYTQRYQYDAVGNIREMKHLATGGNWTRSYDYETANNRLKSTHIGDIAAPVDYTRYQHHAQHGYLEELPHLEEIGWNFKEEVVKTIRQKVISGTPETTYYQYDGQGQRIRKITENQAASGVTPTQKEERIYIAGYEVYKKHSGAHTGLERVSLSLLDGGHRFVMVETRNAVDDGTEQHLVRYQLHNHLGSAALELDDSAQVISYEEYHPYGTTAYQAKNAAIKAAAKRYRYTGMERDEETGLEYHAARYYLPWLGRWCSADPIGIGDGVNIFVFADNNPIRFKDTNGMAITEFERNWFRNVGLEIVKNVSDPKIAYKQKKLMLAHAFMESSGAWKNSKGDFVASTDRNVFNLQGVEGNDGSYTGKRWEYLKPKSPLLASQVDASATEEVNKTTHDKWKKYIIEDVPKDDGTTEKRVTKELRLIDVKIPKFTTVGDSVPKYLEMLKKTFSNAYKALTGSGDTSVAFATGLRNYGTMYKTKTPQQLATEMNTVVGKFNEFLAEEIKLKTGELSTEMGKLAGAKDESEKAQINSRIKSIQDYLKILVEFKDEKAGAAIPTPVATPPQPPPQSQAPPVRVEPNLNVFKVRPDGPSIFGVFRIPFSH